jgi:hypothetical protein
MSLTLIFTRIVVFIISYTIFLFVYKKFDLANLINKRFKIKSTLKVILFAGIMPLLIAIIGIIVINNFTTNKQYQNILLSILLGITCPIIPQIMSKNNNVSQ